MVAQQGIKSLEVLLDGVKYGKWEPVIVLSLPVLPLSSIKQSLYFAPFPVVHTHPAQVETLLASWILSYFQFT